MESIYCLTQLCSGEIHIILLLHREQLHVSALIKPLSSDEICSCSLCNNNNNIYIHHIIVLDSKLAPLYFIRNTTGMTNLIIMPL